MFDLVLLGFIALKEVRIGCRFCEMRTGSLNPEMAVRYRFLVKEAREAERKLQKMAEKVQDSDDEMEEETMLKIAELNTKLEQVQQDVEILLNPATRSASSSLNNTFNLLNPVGFT